MDKKSRVAVVGATGTVGREVVGALQDAGLPGENVTLFASERREGEELEYGEDTLPVEKVEDDSFRGVNAVILAVPSDVARTLAQKAQAAGAWVVDVSPAFRRDVNVPLVLPALNADALSRTFKGRIVSTPGAVTAGLVSVLEPLRAKFGVKRAFVTAMLGVSSAGQRGIAELEKQVADLLSGRESEPEVFPHRIGFNFIPQVGEFSEGASSEERSWSEEAARLWAGKGEAPVLSGTAIQVPTFYGHGLSLFVELGQTPEVQAVRSALSDSKALKVLDAPSERVYPMPMLITADPTVHVGRLRSAPGAPGWFELFAVIDNAGRGAALNAVEAASALLSRGA